MHIYDQRAKEAAMSRSAYIERIFADMRR